MTTLISQKLNNNTATLSIGDVKSGGHGTKSNVLSEFIPWEVISHGKTITTQKYKLWADSEDSPTEYHQSLADHWWSDFNHFRMGMDGD